MREQFAAVPGDSRPRLPHVHDLPLGARDAGAFDGLHPRAVLFRLAAGGGGPVCQRDDYFAYVAVGLVIVSVLHSGLGVATTLQSELVAGTFERLLLSPFGPVLATMSMTLFPMTRALLMSVWTLTIAAIVFGLDLQWSTAWLALPLGLICAVAFAAIALAIAAAVVAFKRAPGIGFVLAGIALVSGVYFPVDMLPAWIEWVSQVQPFTPAVNLLRHVLVGLPMPGPAWEYLLKLAGFTLVTLPIAGWAIGRAVLYAQRRGTLLEY